MSLAMTVATPEVWGQRRGSSKEIGYQLGTMWYVGDLNPNNLFRSISNTAQGAYFRYNVNPRVSVRGQYVQGSVEVFDANHPNAHQQRRNLGFFNLVNEVSFTTEVNFRDHVVGNPKRRLVPFFSAGVAVFGHDPQGIKSNGLLTPLRAIGTEGQDWFPGIDPYKDWGVALPYGLGWKGTLGSTMTFQIEWGARKLWTDYLDDVSGVYVLYNPNDVLDFEPSSALDDFQGALPYNLENETGSGEGVAGEVYQRGDPGRNDRYGFFLVSLGFRVSKKATTCWEQ
jgi:hypothetical protein